MSQLAESYKRNFFRARAEGRVEEPLFDGVLELLDALEADGWLLAVATGKSDRGLKHCLDLHGIHARFVSLQTADRHPSKPHPSMALQAIADAGAAPEQSIVIGDTSFDMGMAARRRGCRDRRRLGLSRCRGAAGGWGDRGRRDSRRTSSISSGEAKARLYG